MDGPAAAAPQKSGATGAEVAAPAVVVAVSSVAAKDILGRYGEDLAVCHLQRGGLQVVERNWRSPDRDVRGELDVIARLGPVLVFCEVKTRRSTAFGLPAEAVSVVKQARIRRLARCWIDAASGDDGGVERNPVRRRIGAVSVAR